MPAKAPRKHIIVSVAPKQLKAIDRAADKTLGDRPLRGPVLRQIMEDFLLSPTELKAGGIYLADNRVRLRFHVSERTHRQLRKLADTENVAMSVVVSTAINNHFPLKRSR